MCSRFELNTAPDELARRFGFEFMAVPNQSEFRPTDLALVITAEGPRMMGWGLSVDWDSKPIINARAEMLRTKKTFRPFLETRCIVPATAYFEWRKDGAARHKNRIHLEGGTLFAFAGLTNGERFTIITCPPAAAIATIHNRMPVILEQQAEGQWINSETSFEAVSGGLIPYREKTIAAQEDAPPPILQADLFD
ncbi:MAG: SOS response-associated peptidase [Rhodospirillales bacterium]|nr:SOS response-associated peptidase [Rhodospirillales bacterium]